MSHTEVQVRPRQTQDHLPPPLARTLIAMLAATLGGAFLTLGCWLILKHTHFPAFNTSQVSRALATFGSAAVVAVVAVLLAWAQLRPHIPMWRRVLTYAAAYLSPAALVVSSTAIPLAATRLYLDGVQVDQGFRTQFLSRMATTWKPVDMAYADIPTYYPVGWFWGGGRLANLLGIPGWEVFQPWALVSISATACLLVPVWQRLSGSLALGTAIALIETAVVLVTTPEEPYAAIVALGAPAATVLAGRAMRGSRNAMIAVAIFLGASASMYTLFTGAIALSVVVIALVVAAEQRGFRLAPIVRLVIVGVSSMLIAAIAWGPYFLAILRGAPHSGATAMHYLPAEGTEVPVPFLAASVIGALSLIGLVYLVVRIREADVRALAVGLIVFYAWILGSMLVTLSGRTLLGFRLDVLVVLQLCVAGALGIGWVRRSGIRRWYPHALSAEGSRSLTLALTVVLALAGLHYVQDIPRKNQYSIDLAYSGTDGFGERADRFSADAGKYHAAIDEFIQSHGHVPTETVVLCDEANFMVYHPYLAFQAFTSHYANPLGEFGQRNEQLEQWAKDSWGPLDTPEKLTAAFDDAPWRAPQAFVLRGNAYDTKAGWKFHVAEDIYPSDPNVRFRGLYFNPAAFMGDTQPSAAEKPKLSDEDISAHVVKSDGLWNVAQVGPFVVVVRAH